MIIADDLTEEGGIRTRILGEIESLEDIASFALVVKVRAKNMHRTKDFRKWMMEHHPMVRLRFAPFLPHYALPVVKELITIPNLLITVVACVLEARRSRPTRVYSHNLECSLAGKVVAGVLGVPHAADVHGDEIEENISFTGWPRDGRRVRFWRALMRIALRRCDQIVCVSRAHESYLRSTYGISGKTRVIPCCVSGPAAAGRDRGSSEDAQHALLPRPTVLLFYSGSSAKWQMVGSMVQFCASLRRAGTDCGMMLLLSDARGTAGLRASTPAELSGRVVVDTVDHRTALGMAARADAAFLFRENIPLNNISSPTKFAEYLISGAPVLITEGVGDYSELVAIHRLGKVVDLARIGDASYASSLVSEVMGDADIRERCKRYALENLTWAVHRESLEEAVVGR